MSLNLRQRAIPSVLSVVVIVITVALSDIGPDNPKADGAGTATVAIAVDADGTGEPRMPICSMETGCATCIGCGVPIAMQDPFLR